MLVIPTSWGSWEDSVRKCMQSMVISMRKCYRSSQPWLIVIWDSSLFSDLSTLQDNPWLQSRMGQATARDANLVMVLCHCCPVCVWGALPCLPNYTPSLPHHIYKLWPFFKEESTYLVALMTDIQREARFFRLTQTNSYPLNHISESHIINVNHLCFVTAMSVLSTSVLWGNRGTSDTIQEALAIFLCQTLWTFSRVTFKSPLRFWYVSFADVEINIQMVRVLTVRKWSDEIELKISCPAVHAVLIKLGDECMNKHASTCFSAYQIHVFY